MFKKFAIAALAAGTLATCVVATTGQAEARNGWVGPAIGLGIAGAIVGGAIASSTYAPAPVYVEPAYRCRWVAQYDRWGNYMGQTKMCREVY
jgi:hypothetical protein